MTRPRTPLLQPRAYFEAHDRSPPVRDATVAVAVVTLVTALTLGGLLAVMAAEVDATTTVPNPAHKPAWFCETYLGEEATTPQGCAPSVPETIERPMGELIAERLSWVPWVALFLVPATWLGHAVVLHVGSAVFGGEGSFTHTLSVAGWGLVPGLARLFGVSALVVYRLRTAPLTGSPEGAVAALGSVLASLEPTFVVAAVVVSVWAGVVRVYGLSSARNVTTRRAFWVVLAMTLVGLAIEVA